MNLLSVIIPIYNTELLALDRCINSVLSQSLKDIEIICINDSPDNINISNFLKKLESIDSRIKVITNKCNIGVSASRNIGLKESLCDYVYFCDSDDELIDFNILRDSLVKLKETNSDICVFKFNTVKDGHIVFNNGINFPSKFSFIEEGLNALPFWYKFSYNVFNKVFNKKFLIENNILFKDIRLAEDLVFTIESILLSNNICFVDNIGYLYYLSDISKWKDFQCDIVYAWKYLIPYIKNIKDVSIYNKIIEERRASLTKSLLTFPSEELFDEIKKEKFDLL